MDQNLAVEAVTWQKISKSVRAVNATLADIIDEISPGDQFTLYKVTYPYGSEFTNRGAFYLPTTDGNMVSLDSPEVPQEMKDNLAYNLGSNPGYLQLSRVSETYITLPDRIIPFLVYFPGDLAGFSRILDIEGEFIDQPISHSAISMWDMSSGARSMFMLPKITENRSHKRLQSELGVIIDPPRGYVDHWQVFRLIAQREHLCAGWHNEILLFTKPWIQHLNDDAWAKLKSYLLVTNRRSFRFWMNIFIWNFVFSSLSAKRKLNTPPYLLDTVKQVFAIATGSLPGLRPTANDDFAPINAIQKAYTDIYRLNQKPILMAPAYLGSGSNLPVYYSLHFPMVEYDTAAARASSTINDLWNIQYVIEKYVFDMLHTNLNIQSSPLYEVASSINFDFFHANPDTTRYPGILSSEALFEEDPLMGQSCQHNQDADDPINCSFVKGCVRMEKQK